MKREVIFAPAFDKRDPDPSKNYGIHGVEIRFHLHGLFGAVQFVAYTDWQMPKVRKEFLEKPRRHSELFNPFQPNPADLGYHSYIPTYEDQSPLQRDCSVIGGVCYYDGSTLNAESLKDALIERGSDGVWQELESYYKGVFTEGLTFWQKFKVLRIRALRFINKHLHIK